MRPRMILYGLCALLWAAMPARAADIDVKGAGSTFSAPAIEAWARQFGQESGVTVSYHAGGSGEGIRRVTAHALEFAVTDVPLTEAELKQDDLLQFPVVVGAVVPVVNLPGVGDGALRLTGVVLADIYLGQITRWDDPAIRALNPGLALPGLPIQVVHRADGSGTSFIFTYYLSKVSQDWEGRLGIGSRLIWPAGRGVQGSGGVADMVHDTEGAIGYVEQAYAVQHGLASVALRNKAGRYVRADESAVRAALASARWSRPGYYEVLVDRDGEASWPIVGISFALVHLGQEDVADGAATLSFFHWVYVKGAQLAASLHYISLDDSSLIGRIESSWNEIHDDKGEHVWKGR